MHRLFWKVFLSFWGALILFALTVVLVASSFIDRMRADEGNASPRERLARHGAAAQAAADAGGLHGLEAWLRRVDRHEIVPIFVLDAAGADILGRGLPASVIEREARRRDAGRRPRGPRRRLVIELPDGEQYRLMPHFQGITLGRVLRRPRVIATPLVVAMVVAGLVGYVLARYVTIPIGRLRHATERVAAGDLDHRVAPSLGGRRDEIAQLAGAFDDMAARLGMLIGTQRQLIGDISHELRSPLARLQAALDLARQRGGGEAGPELDRIERETERLDELIGQLLALAKLESGAAALRVESVDLTALVEGVVADAAFEARAAGRDVRIAASTPAVVTGDPRLLRQAVENVVRNAVRYTAEGTAVEVTLAHAGGTPDAFAVKVRDRGPGVPEAMLDRLFEPFVRVGDARDRASGGHGLGLAIVERSIRAHGGRVQARNEADGGLGVLIHVPERAPGNEHTDV